MCSFLLDVLFFETHGALVCFVRRKQRQSKTDWQSVLGAQNREKTPVGYGVIGR